MFFLDGSILLKMLNAAHTFLLLPIVVSTISEGSVREPFWSTSRPRRDPHYNFYRATLLFQRTGTCQSVNVAYSVRARGQIPD